jgi:Holliday junction resolvasome RuvABC endonuclease subunit
MESLSRSCSPAFFKRSKSKPSGVCVSSRAGLAKTIQAGYQLLSSKSWNGLFRVRAKQSSMNDRGEKRVLAIDPTSRGFGYAFLEGQNYLVDWGTKQIAAAENVRCIFQIIEIIRRYKPDVIALEDPRGKGSRRCHRICRLIDSIRVLAAKHHIMTRRFSRDQVKEVFSKHNARTKHQIAIAVSRQLPELQPQLPRFRKPWMSEDERMSIFDAVSLALVFYQSANARS